jgi:hypothetical protein
VYPTTHTSSGATASTPVSTPVISVGTSISSHALPS